MALAPMISLTAVGPLTYGDIFLIAANGAALLSWPAFVQPTASWRRIATAVLLLAGGGTIAMLLFSLPLASSTSELLSYVTSTAMCLSLAYFLRPTRRETMLLAVSYGIGVLVSCWVAIHQQVAPGFRPTGLTTHPNHLGISALLGAGMWLAILFAAGRRWLRVVAFAACALAAYGVLESGSRAALVGLLAAVLGTIVGARAGRRILILTAGGLVPFYLIATRTITFSQENAFTRLLGGGTAPAADQGRSIRYAVIGQRIRDHPIIGNGFGDSRFGHSLYLQMWAIAGLLGVIAIVLIVFAVARSWFAARKERDVFSVGLWSGYGGYLVAALLSNQMWDRYLWLALALAIMAEANQLGDGSVPASPRDVQLATAAGARGRTVLTIPVGISRTCSVVPTHH
jgi:O-antigen ligase